MDDPVLKRKLFSNRARHIKQIQTGNVQGLFIGGIPYVAQGINMLSRLGPAAMRGYRAFKAARATPKPKTGLITGGKEPSLAGRIMGQQKGLRTTGLGGLESKALRSGSIGRGGITSAELALTAPFAAEGVNTALTGAYEGDYGKMAGGLGQGLLSLPILGRSLRMAGIGAKGTGKVDQVRRAISEVGKKTQQLTSRKGTLPAGAALLGTGFVFDDEGRRVDQKVLGDPIDISIQQYEKDNNIKLTDDQKKEIKQRITSTTAPGAKGTDERSAVPDEQGKVITPTGPKTFKEGDMNENEISRAVVEDSNKDEAGKKLRTKEGAEFQKFYNDIENLTGKDDTNNLLLLKFASGLMTGKSGQEGIRGALDVAGQAATGTLDTMIALKAKEKERKNDLAVAYVKAKKDATNQFQVTGDTRRFLVPDPNAIGGQRSIEVKNFDSGPYKGYEAVKQTNPDGSFTWRIANQGDLGGAREIESSPATMRKLQNQLNGINLGYEMANFVLGLPEDLIGPKGTIMSATESIIGTADALVTGTAGANPDAYLRTLYANETYVDEEEKKMINENLRKDLEDARKVTRADEKRFGFGAFRRPNDEELAKITKAKLVEVRLKYLIANANKAEDRLTQRDIDAAGQLTDIFRFDSPRKIKGNYAAIVDDLNSKFGEVLSQYQEQGGSNEYLLRFDNIPMIREHINKRNQQVLNQNVGTIIDSIQLN
jgi:hypothetical protein